MLFSWLPPLPQQVWILALGRLLSQAGSGFTLFYAPIFFVNQVGLSATEVGIGLGSAAISGVVGRLVGGGFADSAFWGRRRTMLLSLVVSTLSALALAVAHDFPSFIAGNLLMGLGIGLYWPATEAVVADLTKPEQRNEAYGITRLADALGLGVGVVLGGLLINTTGAYRALFIIDAISYLVFCGVVYWAIAETHQPKENTVPMLAGWKLALADRRLLIFCLVNVLFTTYIVQIQSTVPLYFSNFLPQTGSKGFSPATISALFTWHIALSAVCQLPMIQVLNRLRRPQALMLSALLWASGFLLIGVTGISPYVPLLWAILALSVLAIAMVTYMPSSSALVADLAPPSLRGVYLAINSQCWAIGYFIGPPLGGLALDQPRPMADGFWLFLALTVLGAIAILRYLDRVMQTSPSRS